MEWPKFRDNLADKALWALFLFLASYIWSWNESRPVNNVNLRSVAFQLPKNGTEELCTVDPKKFDQFIVENRNSVSSNDLLVLDAVDDKLVLGQLESKTQELLKTSKLCPIKNVSEVSPAIIQIAAILQTDGAYLVDKDCTLDILFPKNNDNYSAVPIMPKPTIAGKVMPIENSKRISWLPWSRKIMHSDIPIRANVPKKTEGKSLDEVLIVKETALWTFQPLIHPPFGILLKERIVPLLKSKIDSKQNTIPVTISCDFVSVADERVRITSKPFDAEVTYMSEEQ